jgi:hypothetical protein
MGEDPAWAYLLPASSVVSHPPLPPVETPPSVLSVPPLPPPDPVPSRTGAAKVPRAPYPMLWSAPAMEEVRIRPRCETPRQTVEDPLCPSRPGCYHPSGAARSLPGPVPGRPPVRLPSNLP